MLPLLTNHEGSWLVSQNGSETGYMELEDLEEATELEGVEGLGILGAAGEGTTDILDDEAGDAQAALHKLEPDRSAQRRGRPLMDPEGGPRDVMLTVGFTEFEVQEIGMAVSFLGGTRSDFFRRCILDGSLMSYVRDRLRFVMPSKKSA